MSRRPSTVAPPTPLPHPDWMALAVSGCCRSRPGVERGRRDDLQQLGDARRGLLRPLPQLLLLDPEQQRPVEAGLLQEPNARRHLQAGSQ